MTEKEKAVGANAMGGADATKVNAKGDASANANNANPNAKKKDEEKKKKAGVVIGIVGLSVAAAIAAAAGAKGCAPNERSYTVTYLTDDEVQNFQGGSFSVKEGTSIGDLKRQLAPLDGYEVEGFYKDPDCTLEFRDDEKVNDDTKIYIEYKEIEITLIFHNDNNPDNNSFENMTIKYYDNLSKLTIPTPESYTSGEGNYTFKCWKTRDGKVVDLKSMNSGKDLLAIDADGEIDLYAEFDFEKVELSYSVTIPDIIKVTRNGEELANLSEINLNDELVITARDDMDWIATSFKVNGQEFSSGNTFTVTQDVTIEVTDAEHRYLELTLKDDQTYEVIGMKADATETNIVIPDNHYDGKAITSIYNSNYSTSGAFYNKKTIQSVVIGNNVTSIGGYAFYYCSELTSVTIGNNVTSIGYDAFKNCSGLTEVNFLGTIDQWASINFGSDGANPLYYAKQLKINGEELQENIKIDVPISAYAFYNCTNLKNITLTENCTSIERYAFYYCSGLVELNYLGTINQWAGMSFFSATTNPLYYARQLKIKGQELEEEVTISASIGSYAFYNCMSIKNLIISDGCEYVGSESFYNCTNLRNLTLEGNIEDIRGQAFANCPNLENVNYNTTGTEIYEKVFLNSGKEVGGFSIIFSDNIRSVNSDLLYYEDRVYEGGSRYTREFSYYVKSISVGKNLNDIYGLEYCTFLKELKFRGSLDEWLSKEIINDRGMFDLITNEGLLTEYTFTNDIPQYMFSGVTSLKKINIEEGVTQIGINAFCNCTGLTEINWNATNVEDFLSDSAVFYNVGKNGLHVKFGDNVRVPQNCFNGVNIEKVTIGSNVTSNSNFRGSTTLKTIVLEESVTSLERLEFANCINLTEIIWNAINVNSFSSNSYVFKDAGTSGDGITVIFGENVQKIPAYCFSYEYYNSVNHKTTYTSANVKSIVINSNIISIESSAFSNCENFSSVTYNGTVEEWITNQLSKGFTKKFDLTTSEGLLTEYTFNSDVPDYALYNVKSLTSVTIGANVESIGEYAFYGCSRLQSVTIGDNVTSIGNAAFDNCSGLTSVTIGANVESIGNYAFYNCNRLEKVYYKGDEEGWTNLQSSIGSNNTTLTGAQIYYFVDSSEENPYKTNPDDTKLYWHYDEDGVTPVVWTKEDQ